MLTNLSESSSILRIWMREIRDSLIQTDRLRFRRNLERIGEIAAYEISKRLEYTDTEVSTPMGSAPASMLAAQPVIATILRAGVPLQQGLLNYFDEADAAFVASYRKHNRDGSFEIEQQYLTSPNLDGRVLIIADTMLATGASLSLSIDAMQENGRPAAIHIVTAIACTEGIEKIRRRHPDVHIWAGDIDEELTARGYIVPGLGDAGDLAYGNKRQS
jgi:uracil phosphoribosyltransferase